MKLGRSTQGRPRRLADGRGLRPANAGPGRCAQHGEADLAHALLEEVAVFSALRIASADRPDEAGSRAAASKLSFSASGQPDIEAGLAAEGRQEGVGLLLGDDLLDDLGRDRLDVGAVGHLGIGHDRGRVPGQ